MLGRAWRCSLCLLVLTLTLRGMLRHIFVSHSTDQNFQIQCGIDGCPEKYWKFDSFRRHVYRLHANYMDLNISAVTPDDNSATDDNFAIDDNSATDVTPDDNSTDVTPDDNSATDATPDDNSATDLTVKSLERISSILILDLKYKELVTQSTVDKVVSKGSTLLQLAQEQLVQKFVNAIKESESKEELKQFVENIQQQVSSTCPFDRVKTAYLQKKFLSENYHIVEPQKILLGESVTRKRKYGQITGAVKQDSFYYIPICNTIELTLCNDKINSLMFQDKKHDTDFLYDVFNGTIFKHHSLSNNENSLFITLYYDDFEVCNPLGTKSHKISMFYYSFLNYPLCYRSKLSSIKLLAVTYRHLIDQYGIDKILDPLVQELKSLYQGVALEINGINKVVYVALLNVCGDTPANNLLGGFKEGVGGALIKCRQCYCENAQMQSQFCEEQFLLRSIQTHLANCDELERSATKQMKHYLSTLYGINRKSLLTELPEFDVCQNMPEDAMHVFLEGVAQYEIKEILKFYVLEPTGIFSIQDFNNKIRNFVYGYDDLDKCPTPILLSNLHSNDNRIRQSASQMLVFLKIIPFVLNDLVDCNDIHMQFLYDLLDIYHILFSPLLTLGTLSLLKDLIQNHLIKFKSLFPNLNIIPKQHYMIHFPMLIKKFGPAIRTWCMRFEGKHKQCKRIATKQNFVNLPLSIAEYIQFSESIDFQSEDESNPMFSNDFLVKNSKVVLNDERLQFLDKLKTFYDVLTTEITSIHKTDHVIINSLHYRRHQSFLLAEASELLPEFGLVQNIYVLNQNHCFFELQMYSTICFNDVFKSYEIDVPNLAEAFLIKNLDDVIDHAPYSSVKITKGLFIPIRYSLDDFIKRYNSEQ